MKALIFFLSTITLSTTVFAATVNVTDAWVAEPIPGASAMAGYMTLTNPTQKVVELSTVESAEFMDVMLHKTIKEKGLMKMEHVNSVKIPANGSITFKQGSYHLMLMGPKKKLKLGDTVTFTAKTKSGLSIPFKATVKKR